ncbi:MAG: hypothetical protein WAL35_00960 [Acidimicrobiales bacterium]
MSARKQTDEEAAEFYSRPENQAAEPGGGKRARPNLTEHVPIRFRPEMLEQVRTCADYDGVTVSTWIRNAVARAAAIRLAQIAPSETAPQENILSLRWKADKSPVLFTAGDAKEDEREEAFA